MPAHPRSLPPALPFFFTSPRWRQVTLPITYMRRTVEGHFPTPSRQLAHHAMEKKAGQPRLGVKVARRLFPVLEARVT